MRTAATRRVEKPSLPYNPANPYDTPEVRPPDQDPSNIEEMPQGRRRHQRQLSAEEVEVQAHAKRMRSKRQTIEALQRRKDELELKRQEAELREQILVLEAYEG
jgi:hypothetical protein